MSEIWLFIQLNRSHKVKSLIRPQLARLISSNTVRLTQRRFHEYKRKLNQSSHVLDIFLRINDPYSYLLVQVLDDIVDRFNIELSLHTVFNINQDMFPELTMWQKNAFYDALSLAELYDLKFPGQPFEVSNDRLAKYTLQLIDAEKTANPTSQFKEIFDHFWHDNHVLMSPPDENSLPDSFVSKLKYNNQININESLQKSLGHYMSAMIYYGGEWYWGIDRLDHLEQRLIDLKLNKTLTNTIYYNTTYRHFCDPKKKPLLPSTNIENIEPLTLYFSIRSPYSYLGLEHASRLADHYKVKLIIKPVLPMVMRGLQVPNIKKMYIFHDTKREAKKHGINYGYVADPLGSGVERCYALFKYAEEEGKAVEYMMTYARAVNALGVRSETDTGLKYIVEKCGLDWGKSKKLLSNSHWTDWADKNLQEMYSLGLWGVPSFKYKNTTVWGQDRIFLIEKELSTFS